MSARPSVQPPAGRNEVALIQRLVARSKEKSEDGLYRALLENRDQKAKEVSTDPPFLLDQNAPSGDAAVPHSGALKLRIRSEGKS